MLFPTTEVDTVSIKQTRTLTPAGYKVITTVSRNGFLVEKRGLTECRLQDAAELYAAQQLRLAVARVLELP